MKKVLLLAAVAFGFNAMGQDAASARLMQAELPVSTAAKEKIEDIMLKRGGAVDDLYDYTDFLVPVLQLRYDVGRHYNDTGFIYSDCIF